MKNIVARLSIICILLAGSFSNLFAQRGYYDAPYKRYEADMGSLSNGAVATAKSYAQANLQSEASDQVCVTMTTADATVEWTIIEAADGLVIRYSVPKGETGVLGVYADNVRVTGITLTSTWSWESLWNNGNPNNGGVSNRNPKKRFDEVRFKLPNKIAVGGKLKLVRESGNISLDFAEMEPVPDAITAPAGAAIYSGTGSDLQSFINNNGGKIIFIPAGYYNVNGRLQFNTVNSSLQGAGMWYSQINFTSGTTNNGGLWGNVAGISFADLFLTTNNASRSNSYKAINGVFTNTSLIKNIWAEHFECGAWIANYGNTGPSFADGFLLTGCRFRNNYADGINLCKGTSNAIVEHCSFRNNGDDDMAIWCANGQECIGNTFRYNTSENCWRASGVAIYGGKNNQAHHLLIKDNVEAGIRANNTFPGVTFNTEGQHVFHDITVINCGTFNDLYNNPVGAIDLYCTAVSGTRVRNIKFYNIDLVDCKNDGIYFNRASGEGFYNLSFENITINGTGKEYPSNNQNNSSVRRGFFVRFAGNPNGYGTYCGMYFFNRGGNALIDEEKAGIGGFSWTKATGCTFIAAFTPTNAVTGSAITIRGTNFTSATAVTFGGTAASSFTVVSDSIITAVVGNGSYGPVAVTNTFGTVTKNGFNYMLCPATINTSLMADITGGVYQWQVNTGSGFADISNNANYSGTASRVLLINNINSSWYGYQYRCFVNGSTYSNQLVLKFTNTWTGAGGTAAWENPANWSCGIVPDENTDVIIPSGTVVLNSSTSCRSISISNAATCTINSGYTLTLVHTVLGQ
ncbi:MAG TPA: right-handed parallel beta-helix repeat-containing protein [Ferruginibacter sp.]|nr:right-handed parallel beta-helix repeat-containing protein [Ferruginibacter sp.]HMP22311.1 right-handed parallel beta-helix repeat-containing protein [Ferruginibacter sp.]